LHFVSAVNCIEPCAVILKDFLLSQDIFLPLCFVALQRCSKKEDGCLFRPLSMDDLPAIWERQQKLHTLSSEFDVFRLYAWLPLDQSEIAFWRNQFVIRCQVQGETWYIAPGETEDFHALLKELISYERAAGGHTFRLLNSDRDINDYPSGFVSTQRRDLFDYIYRASDLIEMKGRDYSAKRNQVSQFKRNYDWRFEPLTSNNRSACIRLIDMWDCAHEGIMLPFERIAVERMLSLEQDYGQSGGVLFVGNEPIAFAIGSHPRSELLDIVAEKSLPNYIGSYSMIIQSYAAYAHSLAPFDYINREEDMGLENLRNAKLQLKPVALVEKTLMTLDL